KQATSASSTTSPEAGCTTRTRRTARGGSGRKGWSTRAATSNAPFPESRISASADRPGGVARATMGSDNTSLAPFPLPVSRFPLRLPLLPQAALRDHVLLRDAEDVAHSIIEVQPRCEAEEQERHERRHEV